MEDEARVSANGGSSSSYWLDACEDISDFVDFDAPIAQEVVEIVPSNDFFGGIDHILDSIKNGGVLSPATENGNGNVNLGSTGGDVSAICKRQVENSDFENQGREANAVIGPDFPKYSTKQREKDLVMEERWSKKARVNGCLREAVSE